MTWRHGRRHRGGTAHLTLTVVLCAAVAAGCSPRAGADDDVSGGAAARPAEAAGAGPAIPAVVGQDLQRAEDRVQEAGYRYVTPHDAAGRGRRQILYGNWRVCDQWPAPGPAAEETRVRLGVVARREECPAPGTPTAAPDVRDGRMPDVSGRSVNVVRAALRGHARVRLVDLRGRRRYVLLGENWRVCTQTPVPGTRLTGQQVSLGIVRFGERCP